MKHCIQIAFLLASALFASDPQADAFLLKMKAEEIKSKQRYEKIVAENNATKAKEKATLGTATTAGKFMLPSEKMELMRKENPELDKAYIEERDKQVQYCVDVFLDPNTKRSTYNNHIIFTYESNKEMAQYDCECRVIGSLAQSDILNHRIVPINLGPEPRCGASCRPQI